MEATQQRNGCSKDLPAAVKFRGAEAGKKMQDLKKPWWINEMKELRYEGRE